MKKIKYMYRKSIACSIGFLLLAAIATAQDIYTVKLKGHNKETIDLSAYKGKKILFITLPMNNEKGTVSQLTHFAQVNAGVLQVVGVLSEEDGYSKEMKDSVQKMYSNSGIVITEGMSTRKGSKQSSLMQWLTDRKKNLHFDVEVKGVNHKFFVSETGRLIAVIDASLPLNAPPIARIMTSKQN
jgi:glutathione peroxidase